MSIRVTNCCICNRKCMGSFLIIEGKKYHMFCIRKLQEENEKLKEELKEYHFQNINLREDIMIKKKSLPNKKIKDKTFWNLYDMPTYEELEDKINKLERIIELSHANAKDTLGEINYKQEAQQKEFIKYLEEKIKQTTPKLRWKHYNEDGFNDYDLENSCYIEMQPVNKTYEEILQKYKEIIGEKDK